MKKRTFFITLVLFLVFFNFAISVITAVSLKDRLIMQKEKCLAEHNSIASSLIKDIQALNERDTDVKENIYDLMSPYSYFIQNKRNFIAVYQNNTSIFEANSEQYGNLFTEELFSIGGAQTSAIKGKKSPVLFIAGQFPTPYQEYGIVTGYNMKADMSSWRHMKNMLFLLGGFFSILLAVCLLFLLERIFKPLSQIADASMSIASGNYQNRIIVNGSDELGNMAKSFNHMADEINNQIMELKEAANQKQCFIDNFAHELRTPLTAIYGYAEYMQRVLLTEEDKIITTGYIMSECKRLQNMAYQLLNLAMLREQEITLEKLSIKEIFTTVKYIMSVRADEKQLSILYKAEWNDIYGNRELLESLIINLFDNAIKASDIKGTILVSAVKSEGAKQIIVRDNGRGMSKDQLKHVKEAFYRADKSRSRADGGTGLGLSICEQIAQIHKAQIHFMSKPEIGTAAVVTFTT